MQSDHPCEPTLTMQRLYMLSVLVSSVSDFADVAVDHSNEVGVIHLVFKSAAVRSCCFDLISFQLCSKVFTVVPQVESF